MTDPFDSLAQTDGPVDPEPRFRTLLLERLREELTTDLDRPVELEASPRRRPRPRRAVAVGLAAALATAAAVGAALVLTRGSRPLTPLEQALHDVGPAPLAPPYGQQGGLMVLTVSEGVLEWNGQDLGRFPDDQPDPPLPGSPWGAWSGRSIVVTDVAGRGGGTYVATCCGPDTGLWRNGVLQSAATKIDVFGLQMATADPTADTVTDETLGGVTGPVAVPGVVDVVVTSGKTPTEAIALSSGPNPALTLLPSGQRIELDPALPDACALAELRVGLVLLIGRRVGQDPCVGDIGVIVDRATGAFRSAFRFPARVHSIDGNHSFELVAVTTDGHVLDLFAPTNTWTTVPWTDAVYAAFPNDLLS